MAEDAEIRSASRVKASLLLSTYHILLYVSEETFQSVCDTMVVLARDKIPAVRVQAMGALARTQDPTNKEDEVVQEYIRILATDSSK